MGIKNPTGLLQDGEVFTKQFLPKVELDCLRSPHLYREHPVRTNAYGKDADIDRWFGNLGIYISCHDLISKVVTCVFDGDKLLVCADKTLVNAAKRNMQGIVPLCYDMKKAGNATINAHSIYQGMTNAYTGGNIGPISNNISKLWNDENCDLNLVKLLCLQTNECIDYAKTLYKSTAPEEVRKSLGALGNAKLPHFFIYAKDKGSQQVLEGNQSVVNRLPKIISHQKLAYKRDFGGKFNYKMLMHDPNLVICDDVQIIIGHYKRLVKESKYTITPFQNSDSFNYKLLKLRTSIFSLPYDSHYIADCIIYSLFYDHPSKHKRIFWEVFEDIVLENLKKNLANLSPATALCKTCYGRFQDGLSACPHCETKVANTKKIVCADCGESFYVAASNANKVRCNNCQRNRHNDKKRYGTSGFTAFSSVI